MTRPVLAEHCRVCEKVATCSCPDCQAPQVEYAQIVGGGLVKIAAREA